MAKSASSTPPLLVLYGSQTGNTEDFAVQFGQKLGQYRVPHLVLPLDECLLAQLQASTVAVFMVSTAGQGEVPDNMKRFWMALLRKSLQPDFLSALNAAVLAFGDSSYPKFNYAGKRLHRRLLQLGASMVTAIGLADDQHPRGPLGIADPWLAKVFTWIREWYCIPEGLDTTEAAQLAPPRYRIAYTSDIDSSLCEPSDTTDPKKYDKDRPFLAPMIFNRRLTATDHFQDVRLIGFSLEGSSLSHSPGQVLMVKPENHEEAVEQFLNWCGLDPDRPFEIQPGESNVVVPPGLVGIKTLRLLARTYLDFQAVPRRSFFEKLAFLAVDMLEKNRLQELSSVDGTDDLYSYCFNPRRSHLEVLIDFPSLRGSIPMEYLLDIIPSLRPRAFSIASSTRVHPGEVHIAVARVEYQTKIRQPRRGTCSYWLTTRRPELESCLVRLWVRSGSLVFPRDPAVPVIMVGPGTGAAPFISYLSERSADQYSPVCVPWFFVGYRFRSKDFLWADFLLGLHNQGRLHLVTAFSRDQSDKVYVQHLLEECGEEVARLIVAQAGFFMVAGNAKNMPLAVRSTLREILQRELNGQQDAGERFLCEMERTGRYQVETWA